MVDLGFNSFALLSFLCFLLVLGVISVACISSSICLSFPLRLHLRFLLLLPFFQVLSLWICNVAGFWLLLSSFLSISSGFRIFVRFFVLPAFFNSFSSSIDFCFFFVLGFLILVPSVSFGFLIFFGS